MRRTKKEATERVEEVRQMMHEPGKWEKSVWQGADAWHWSLTSGPMTINEVKDGFTIDMSTDGLGGSDPIWSVDETFKTPQKAVNKQIKEANKQVEYLKAVVYWARTGNMSNKLRVGLGMEPIKPLPKEDQPNG